MNGPSSGARTHTLGLLLTQETLEDRVCRIYEAERDKVYRHLVLLGVLPADAQDLTQEVFVTLYLTEKKGKEVEAVRTWLWTVSSRLALNWRRNEGRRPLAHAVGDEHAAELIPGMHVSPELALLQREKLVAVHNAIRGLSPQQRACLRLRAEGFRYRAIAEILGVKIPTVAEQLRRALTRLRKVIHD